MNLGNSLLKNWLTLLGIVASLGALFVFVLLAAVDFLFGHSSPYFSLLAYVAVPAVFVGGLFLIVAGLVIWYWLNNRPDEPGSGFCSYFKVKTPDLKLDLGRLSTWLVIISFLVVIGVSGTVVAFAGYKVYHWSESDEFCGKVCHNTMEPMDVAHANNPHAKIKCVECHVGPGVEAYLYAKINGTRQLFQNVTGTYHTPIPVPVAAMYGRHLDGKTKIEHTCMECHWNERYIGQRGKTFTHFLRDEGDLKTTYRLIFNVGGTDPNSGQVSGIHWHTAENSKVEFVTENNKREGRIIWIRTTDQKGENKIFSRDEEKYDPATQKLFTMTCLECHNRPAHRYHTPVAAVDMAFELGSLPRELGENIKLNVIELLTGEYKTQAEAFEKIAEGMKEAYPDSEHLAVATKTVQGIYRRNIFPEMKSTWENYPDNLGHMHSEGCTRCHNKYVVDEEEGESVPNGCNDCHLILAQSKEGDWDEADPKGLVFKHPDGNRQRNVAGCITCHHGTY